MPVVSASQYADMLDLAKRQGFAYAAVNVTSSETVNAALRGFSEANADGIIQISTGGASFASGAYVKDMVTGATALAGYVRSVADAYPIYVALHTDHCRAEQLDQYVRPLLAASRVRVESGLEPLFLSHMFDGSDLSLEENLAIAAPLLDECAALGVILEVEAGVVGGEEDGITAEGLDHERLYTTPADLLRFAEVLGTGQRGRYLLAATFGNVHGVYRPGTVELRPKILKAGQEAVRRAHGPEAEFAFVFHGGSGSDSADIAEAVSYGVVKMNIDSDAQYAFTRPIADHMFKHYDGVLMVDDAPAEKHRYDPRTYLGEAESSMAARVGQACEALGSATRSSSWNVGARS